MIRFFLIAASLVLAACGQAGPSAQHEAQPSPRVAEAMAAARTHVAANEEAIVTELRTLLALPNVASNPADIKRNAELLVAMLERRGASARILETPDAPASVYGEITTPGATRTLLFYAHFDGQPVGDPEAWVTPAFTPTLRAGRAEDDAVIIPWANATFPLADDARIYARSASDDKSPIVAMLAALDAMRAANIPLSANIKFFLEGEEEAGSPNLARTLETHRDALGSDLWIFGDGPIDPRGLPRVVLGVRGVISFRLTTYGPAMSLHSGHYGNVAPNPAARLAHLIASMRADDGTIIVDGFDRAADPISPQARALAREAYDDGEMLRGPQLAGTESGLTYGESVLRTALNVTQLQYASVGAQRNAIGPEASAGFDVRIAPGVTLEEVRELITAHVRAQGYELVDDAPTEAQRFAHAKLARLEWGDLGYVSAMSPPDNPGVARVIDVMRAATNNEVRVPPLLGGSLPIAPIGDVLNTPFVIVPIVNADNNQHAPNENVRMREFRHGIELYAALLAEAGNGWD
ncbi:N-acyl-L-amino acid amidohydrolase [alpha proteobacterium U9-1i]|nr:N-acyl-L-amino acid amidohydrolase [alpha proteobacterium U9-1i]